MVGLAVERASSSEREIAVRFLNPKRREVDNPNTDIDDTKVE